MAAAAYFDTVQKIFIAFYQRPADPAGLKYWADRIDAANGDAAAVVSAFATSPEAVALYGTIDATTIGTVIDKIYLALFNKAPDAAGKKFYVDGFTAGTFTAGTIALNILIINDVTILLYILHYSCSPIFSTTDHTLLHFPLLFPRDILPHSVPSSY